MRIGLRAWKSTMEYWKQVAFAIFNYALIVNNGRRKNLKIFGLTITESEDEEFFECTSEELANEEVLSTKPQLKAKHLLWNKPAGRLAKHPSLRLTFLHE